MQTILGAGGTIGTNLAKSLKDYTQYIRVVSRNPRKVNLTDTLLAADLTKRAEVDTAVAGSEIVYLTVGFEYQTSVWRAVWPPLMRDVVDACEKHRAKLVFFDNVYAYGPESIPHMTEDSPVAPISEKGKIRAEVVRTLLTAVDKGRIHALIARSADFYGPNTGGKSVLMQTVFENLRHKKAAVWLGRVDKKHSFTFTPDAARGTALLGNTPDAFNQTWHLPTDGDALTARGWVELFARELNARAKVRAIPAWMIRALGLFVPLMRELGEMVYQYDRDYVFDSSKFTKRFSMKPTGSLEGVRAVIADAAANPP